jgi:polyketide cyclase/dehydrase/lipid transport protein
VLHQGSASIEIGAPARAVWDVVSDVTRVGEWSAECRGCSWETGSTTAVAGARFRGRNRRGGIRWTRLNEVVVADAPRELVWRTVAAGVYPDSVEWRLRLTEDGAWTRVEESYRILKIPKIMEWAISVAMPGHRDRSHELLGDLGRLKQLVEAASPST